MANILIFEDDERQRSWALEQLGDNHTLTLCSYEDESVDMTEFDFVLTDGSLPEKSDHKPNFEVGIRIFRKAYKLLEEGELKGIAFVSNYEHHVDRGVSPPWEEVEALFEFSYLLKFPFADSSWNGKDMKIVIEKYRSSEDRSLRKANNYSLGKGYIVLEDKREVIEEDLKNSLVFFDSNYATFSYAIAPEGAVEHIDSLSIDIPKDIFDGAELYYACQKKGYTFAKPWKEIVKVLELPK